MRIQQRDELLYVTAELLYQGHCQTFTNVLLDTGSGSTIFATDQLLLMGLEYEPDDQVHRIRGVGGTEFVFTKCIAQLRVATLCVTDFLIEVGALAYGFELDGIIGVDFLHQVGAVIDLGQMKLYSSASEKREIG
jgi:hypothetical protein